MAESPASTSIIKTKRTRIVGSQSKNGCLTCKNRRIKCDEETPGCVRCARSGLLCAGYLKRTRLIDLEARTILDYGPLSGPMWSLKTGGAPSQQRHHLAQLGMHLMVFESFNKFGAAVDVLSVLLPQLCHSIPAVNAAASALGGVHNFRNGLSSHDDEVFARSCYCEALGGIRQDLLTQPQGPIPLIITCLVLSIVEILLEQESKALFHIGGALKLLQQRRISRLGFHSRKNVGGNTDLTYPEDPMDVLFRTVDFQTSSYAMSRVPELPLNLTSSVPSITDLNSAHDILVRLAHECYGFTTAVYKFKYQPKSTVAAMFIEQGRHIAHLSTWLEQFNLKVLSAFRQTPVGSHQLKAYSHALILRMTASSTMIHLSCVLNPYEAAYDAYALEFQQIIADAEAVLLFRERDTDLSGTVRDQYFTTGLASSNHFF